MPVNFALFDELPLGGGRAGVPVSDGSPQLANRMPLSKSTSPSTNDAAPPSVSHHGSRQPRPPYSPFCPTPATLGLAISLLCAVLLPFFIQDCRFDTQLYNFDGELSIIRHISTNLPRGVLVSHSPIHIHRGVETRPISCTLEMMKGVFGLVHDGHDIHAEVQRIKAYQEEIEGYLHSMSAARSPGQRPLDQSEELLMAALLHFEGKLTTALDTLEGVQRLDRLAYTDGNGMPDFALLAAAARVAYAMTSRTHRPSNGFGGAPLSPCPHGPGVALLPDISVGNCWALAGSYGQIGVLFGRPIRLTHFTIDYPTLPVSTLV